jgi:hypothetical protein
MNVTLHPHAYSVIEDTNWNFMISIRPSVSALLSGRIPQIERTIDRDGNGVFRAARVDVPWWLAITLWFLGFVK